MAKLRYHLRKKSGGRDDTVKEGLLNKQQQPTSKLKLLLSTNITKLLQLARKKTNSTTTTTSSSSTFADHIVIDEIVQSSTDNTSLPTYKSSPLTSTSKQQNKESKAVVPLKKSISWVDDVVTFLSSPVADAIDPDCRLPLASSDDDTIEQQQPYDERPSSSGIPSCRLSLNESLDVVPDFNDAIVVPTRSSRSKDTVKFEGLVFDSGSDRESTASLSSISSEEDDNSASRNYTRIRQARRTIIKKGRVAKARGVTKGRTNVNTTTTTCFEMVSFITQPLLDIFDTKYCGCVTLSSLSKERDEEENGINMYDYQIVNVIQH